VLIAGPSLAQNLPPRCGTSREYPEVFRNYLMAALRNLTRNRLYAGINIVGLGVGFTAAILMALFVRSEFNYDTFFPGYDRVFNVTEIYHLPGGPPLLTDTTLPNIAAAMKLDYPSIDTIARLAQGGADLRVGAVEALDSITWADPGFFKVMPFPVIAGDPIATLARPRPISRVFLDQLMQRQYMDVIRQGIIFAAFAGVALFLACLGLFGLAAFATERRIKEIGIRKAMGASSADIMRLFVWEFSQPVLWANLIAWPIAYYCAGRWLDGFAYHVNLKLWMFLAAGTIALTIALFTVSGQAFFAARAKPVRALRYE
jgi:hypothetical protein